MGFSVVSEITPALIPINCNMLKWGGWNYPPLPHTNYFLKPNFSISARYLSMSVFFR